MSKTSSVPDHCRQYALSDPLDSDYQSSCDDHTHQDICDRCEELTTVLQKIEEAISKMPAHSVSEDTTQELLFVFDQAKNNILAWKAHLLRSVNQDEARLDVLDALDESSVLLVQDWAMKFLPRKYRESQSDWFGKRGLSWHITVATRRQSPDQGFEMMTFAHVFKSCSQDSLTVQAIMSDVLGKLKEMMPTLRFVYYRQDNAGCYRSGNTILGAVKAGEACGITVRRLDFSDPQGGKGACDRKAATIKAHIKVHLNEGHDVETASQMVDAMQSSGGVPGLSVRLCDHVVSSPVLQIKLDGVSTIANVEYSDTFIRVWKAYGMGPGKKISFSKLNLPADLQTASLSTRCSAEEISAQFCAVKSRRTASNPSASEGGVQGIPCTTGSGLYPCPEEGCTKSYQRFSSLQNHLDCGKHVRSLEQESMIDKAVRGYAARLEGQFAGVPQFGDRARAGREDQSTTQKTTVSMGWALKSSQGGKTRFSDKQRDYLTSQFQIGEETGLKASPAQVSRLMMTAKDASGNRMFSSSEFLTVQQITSFFSRLASKRSLAGHLDIQAAADDEDVEAEVNEAAFQELSDCVMANILPTHPICYDSFNLCQLMSKSKLSTLAVKLLKEICDHYGIATEDITSRRKVPYIERLEGFLKQCDCCRT